MKFFSHKRIFSNVSLFLCGLLLTLSGYAHEEEDPAEIQIGERLFLETRFAQHHVASPDKADPVMDATVTVAGTLPGPFKGQTMNCRACHMVDEHADNERAGMRSYSDYARHSPIPQRADGATLTPRNSQSLLGSGNSAVLHTDGEFATMADLVKATLTGRNYGWLPGERQQAIRHVANIIRQDTGDDALGVEFGGAYARVLKATDKALPETLILPAEYRLDVAAASDEEIFAAVTRLIAVYVDDLTFEKASPYDAFLKKNHLPAEPDTGENAADYSARLRQLLADLAAPKFVTSEDGEFETHSQAFVFGAKELAGMKVFFDNKAGNCVTCHQAPEFSDGKFHNTGRSQLSYDAVHGAGAFAKLAIPDLPTRTAKHDDFLPASARHPAASGRFRGHVQQDKPGYADLGLWNVFANADMPGPQAKLRRLLCDGAAQKDCADAKLLNTSVARFRTPTLRDLGHSAPYMHDGGLDRLADVVNHYLQVSELARANKLRNAGPQLNRMHINAADIDALTAFLKALNEDYE